MAVTVVTQDLDNYPGITKNVTVDQTQIVPTGYEGDEQFVMSFSTTAYSDNDNRTAIDTIYVTNFKGGWCKSSGFTGTNSKFNLDASHYKLDIKLDATVSGADGSGYYTLELNHSDGTPLSGETIAADMEEKVRAVADSIHTADTGFASAYRNASVEFTDGQFWVVSGSVSNYYTGADRSSVVVAAASSADCSAMLGFDLVFSSVDVAAITVKESVLTQDYTTNTDTVNIQGGMTVTNGDCLMITDGTNTDYFTAISGTIDTAIKVTTSAVHNFIGITHSYNYLPAASGTGTKVQILREQDPDGGPTPWYTDMDSISRLGIKSVMSQIDYSS